MMWLTRATEDGACCKCGGDYHTGDPVGMLGYETIHGVKQFANHPECWLSAGLEMLDGGNGAMSPLLTKAQREERRKLVHHWAQLAYRERCVRATHEGRRLEAILGRLEKARDGLRILAAVYGGVPDAWKKR